MGPISTPDLSTMFGWSKSDHLLLDWNGTPQSPTRLLNQLWHSSFRVPLVVAHWTYLSWTGSVIRPPLWCWCHSWILFQGSTKDRTWWGGSTGSQSAPHQALGVSFLPFSSGHWVWHRVAKTPTCRCLMLLLLAAFLKCQSWNCRTMMFFLLTNLVVVLPIGLWVFEAPHYINSGFDMTVTLAVTPSQSA